MTNEKYPSVRDKEISEVRKKQVEEDIQRGFEKNLLSKQLVRVKQIKSEEISNYSDREFFKVGLASITNKIWFVDEPGGEVFYSYKGLGYDYGKAVADGETKGIIEKIIENAKSKNIIYIKEEKLKEMNIIQLFEQLEDNNKYRDELILLTNVYDEFNFWYMDDFEPYKNVEEKDFPFSKPYGFLNICNVKIPVFWSRHVPKGITLLFDKNKIGTLLIKTSLKIEITDNFSPEKKEKIIRDIPSLKEAELDEKVEIQVYEIISFKPNPEAVVMLKHEIKEE